MNSDELAAIFDELGAPDPRAWANSEINEGINQLGRYLFLKGAWDLVVDDDSTDWMEHAIRQTLPDRDRPFDGIAHALQRLLAVGADKQDLNQLVRGMQVQLLFGLCNLLDDAASVEGNTYQDWMLFEVDAEQAAARPISGLHESVLGTDPTGREMRPRP